MASLSCRNRCAPTSASAASRLKAAPLGRGLSFPGLRWPVASLAACAVPPHRQTPYLPAPACSSGSGSSSRDCSGLSSATGRHAVASCRAPASPVARAPPLPRGWCSGHGSAANLGPAAAARKGRRGAGSDRSSPRAAAGAFPLDPYGGGGGVAAQPWWRSAAAHLLAPLSPYAKLLSRSALTLAVLSLVRLGHFIQLPGIDPSKATAVGAAGALGASAPGGSGGAAAAASAAATATAGGGGDLAAAVGVEAARLLSAVYNQSGQLAASLFDLGILPIINASIIVQVRALGLVRPTDREANKP